MRDSIVIEELELRSRIGITEGERSEPQRLTVSLVIEPERDFRALGDDFGKTVDYAAVCGAVRECASARERNLIETLAAEIAETVREGFAVCSVEVELRKFILPETRFVAVRVRR
jgi:7,8-dihydroneopterin aldolase/epimerase/oxygenase